MYPCTTSKPQDQLSFYFNYGKPISSRTKRLMKRTAKKEGTPSVLPLLTLLIRLLDEFKTRKADGYVLDMTDQLAAPAVSSAASSFRNLRNSQATLLSSDIKQCTEFEPNVLVPSRHTTFQNTLKNLQTQVKDASEREQLKVLGNIVESRLPNKAKFIVQRLFHCFRHQLYYLLECPEILESELTNALQASKDTRSSRRRRGRRGGKRAKRGRIRQAAIDLARSTDTENQ